MYVIDDSPNTLSTRMSIPWGKLQSVIDWCDHNCAQSWTMKCITVAGQNDGDYRFEFRSSEDLVKFVLWCK